MTDSVPLLLDIARYCLLIMRDSTPTALFIRFCQHKEEMNIQTFYSREMTVITGAGLICLLRKPARAGIAEAVLCNKVIKILSIKKVLKIE